MGTTVAPAATRDELAVPASFNAKVFWTSRRAAEIGNFLETLREAKGKLTTDVIIEAADKQGSILRDFFDWKHTSAAHKYRRMQARQLMKRLHVQAHINAGPIRAFAAVQIKGEPYQKLMYLPLTAALQTENFRQEIMGRMRARAKAYEALLSTVAAYRRTF